MLVFKYVLLSMTLFNQDSFKREISFYILDMMISKPEFVHELDNLLQVDKKFTNVILNS